VVLTIGFFNVSCTGLRSAAKEGSSKRDTATWYIASSDEASLVSMDAGVSKNSNRYDPHLDSGSTVSSTHPNVVHPDGGTQLERTPLEPFFQSLDQLTLSGHGLVRVLHYGDSHTAAGFMTHAIRKVMQTCLGNGGPGFVLLGQPWPTYRVPKVAMKSSGHWRTRRIRFGQNPEESDGRYGLCGVSVEGANKETAASFTINESSPVSRVEIFFLKQPNGGSFKIIVEDKLRQTVGTAAKDISAAFAELELESGERKVEITLNGDGNVRLFGAVLESEGPGIVWDTLGINGAFFFTPLRWDENLLKEQVARRNPSLIVTMYGTNESNSRSLASMKYERKVKKILKKLRAGAPEAACLMLGPMDRDVPRETPYVGFNLNRIIEIQKRVAKEEGCSFFDTRKFMGGPRSYSNWVSRGLAQTDGIHLTTSGYRLLGKMIAAKLLDAYKQNRHTTCQTDTLENKKRLYKTSNKPLNQE
jgi:lysophospholipase L1-like esterase